MTTSREQFEQAFEDVTGWELSEHPDRSYCEDLNLIWEMAWKESRDALVVELPSSDKHESTWQYRDDANAVLIAAGITVKGDSDEQANS